MISRLVHNEAEERGEDRPFRLWLEFILSATEATGYENGGFQTFLWANESFLQTKSKPNAGNG